MRAPGAAFGLVLVTAFAAVTAGGCAGASPSGRVAQESGSAPEPTASWAAKANRICVAADRQLDGLPQPRTRGELASFFASMIAMNKRWDDELTALRPPHGQARRLRRLAKLFEEDERLLDRLLAATERGDKKGFDAAQAEYLAVAKRQNALYRALGADRCAGNAHSPS